MITFFHTAPSARWKYTLDFICREREIDYRFMDDRDEFNKIEGVKVNCEESNSSGGVFQLFSPILEEDTVGERYLGREDESPTLNGQIDYVGAVFYLLSFYQEYITEEKDEHGRFPGSASMLKRLNWLERPMADIWAEKWLHSVFSFYQQKIDFPEKSPRIIPTFDIDNAYAFQHKGFFRNVLAYAKDKIRLDFTRVIRRITWAMGKAKDPYDTFAQILNIAKTKEVKVFWLTASSGGKDNNLSISKPAIQQLIFELGKQVSMGIHPSYASEFGTKNGLAEKNELAQIVRKDVTDARMHFLRLNMPTTYRSLLSVGILRDHTVGFADEVGFRIGTAREVSWFDLEKNELTPLRLQPFVYMDGTLLEYKKYEPEKAKVIIRNLYDEVKKHGGNFEFLWHNETIGDFGKWKGWSSVLDYSLNLNENGK